MVRPTRTLIALLFSSALLAGDYYLSYRLRTKDFTIVDEHLSISRAMAPFRKKSFTICSFESETNSFQAWSKKNETLLLECLFRHGVLLKSQERYTDLARTRESIELILPPTPLQVDFNDGLVIIKKIQP
ncbi:hypothetical protein [Hydrogenimonas cancrithermarum]|uniref:Uncharacterized protein n=1 Tax=Hydrogenimonas cancrithermarum TaxID=2993563 RepID=A0ABM8FLB3_9BACT|nr:hypothetical protein [Hydrogenimonas cancrithermarum]BDY12466.1 hypothetical protein HCR_07780 [Hydrogenimonas cancrithermarum]